jgi:hypothetical protein
VWLVVVVAGGGAAVVVTGVWRWSVIVRLADWLFAPWAVSA